MRVLLVCLLLCALVVSNSKVSVFFVLIYGGGKGVARPLNRARGRKGLHKELESWIPSLAGLDSPGKRDRCGSGALRTKGVRTCGRGGRSPWDCATLLAPDM